jgi:hypothetical protein
VGASNNTRLAFWADVWRQLLAPIILCIAGVTEFLYQAFAGHDQAFGLIGVGLALAGAGLGADMLTRMGAK